MTMLKSSEKERINLQMHEIVYDIRLRMLKP
ncbi:hypothetical protein Golob_024056, partial [Gossypium lobatum]|nr:hypothetical protein [Gossypium lobatum]